MPLARRLLLDFVVGLVALAILFSASLLPDEHPWIDLFGWGPVVASLVLLMVGAALAGYREPSLGLVWLHARLVGVPLALLVLLTFSRGFEATPYRFVAIGIFLAVLPLLGASFAGFFLRRRVSGRQTETPK